MNTVVRPAVAVLAAAVVTVGIAGCNTSPGAAALVGDYRISTATLQHEVDRALADPTAQSQLGTDRAKFTRDELSQLIHNRLVALAAATHHVRVTSSEIDQQIAQFAQQAGGNAQLLQSAAQSGVPKDEIRTFIRYYVLEQKLGAALVANLPVSRAQLQAAYQQNIDSFDTVHAAHILVKSKKLADRILGIVRQHPIRFASLAKQYSTDTSNKDSGGDLGTQPKSKFVPAFGNAVFAAKVGSYIEVHSQFGWHVVHVIAHHRVSLAQATPQLKSSILGNASQAQAQREVAAEGKRVGVHVNPRYGKWDPSRSTVVPIPPTNAVSSPSPARTG